MQIYLLISSFLEGIQLHFSIENGTVMETKYFSSTIYQNEGRCCLELKLSGNDFSLASRTLYVLKFSFFCGMVTENMCILSMPTLQEVLSLDPLLCQPVKLFFPCRDGIPHPRPLLHNQLLYLSLANPRGCPCTQNLSFAASPLSVLHISVMACIIPRFLSSCFWTILCSLWDRTLSLIASKPLRQPGGGMHAKLSNPRLLLIYVQRRENKITSPGCGRISNVT